MNSGTSGSQRSCGKPAQQRDTQPPQGLPANLAQPGCQAGQGECFAIDLEQLESGVEAACDGGLKLGAGGAPERHHPLCAFRFELGAAPRV